MVIKKFIKFMIIGASGTLINLLIFGTLIFFNSNSNFAATIAFIVAATNNFYWNFKWTFKNDASHKSIRKKYVQFFIISLANFGLNLVFLNVLDNSLNFSFLTAHGFSLQNSLKIKTIFAQGIAIGITSILNFVGNYLITFKGEKNV